MIEELMILVSGFDGQFNPVSFQGGSKSIIYEFGQDVYRLKWKNY